MTMGVQTRGAAANSARKIKPSITTALVVGFGTLIVAGMVVVLTISMWSAQKNTRTLLAGNANLAVLSLVPETRRRLAPVSDNNAYVANLITTGRIDIEDRKAMATMLLTAMAGTEQVFGMAFIYADGRNLRVRRGEGALPDAEIAARPSPPA